MAGVVQSVQALASSLGALPPEFVRPEHERPRATTFRGASPLQIPVVDMSLPDAGCRMVEAATEWGIFQAVNHGVPADAVAELQRVGREKIWSDNLFHTISPPAAVNHGFWPDKPRGYRQANEAYCGRILRLTLEVLERLSAGLGLEEGAMAEAFGGGDDGLVLIQMVNFYPPCPQPELALGFAPHTDLCALTVLVANGVPGLQVSMDGLWYDVEHVPGALIVNVGDQIEIFSNGRYRSVLHRATVSREKTRMSWPVFVEPRREYLVAPHPRLVAGEIPAKYDYKAKTFENYRYCRINKLPQ
ncbi:hypothetical protein VPH35_075214 [Triticum aestivum]